MFDSLKLANLARTFLYVLGIWLAIFTSPSIANAQNAAQLGLAQNRADILISYMRSLVLSGNPASASALQSIFPFLSAQHAAELKILIDEGGENGDAVSNLVDRSMVAQGVMANFTNTIMSRRLHPLTPGASGADAVWNAINHGNWVNSPGRRNGFVKVRTKQGYDGMIDLIRFQSDTVTEISVGHRFGDKLWLTFDYVRNTGDTSEFWLLHADNGEGVSIGGHLRLNEIFSTSITGFTTSAEFEGLRQKARTSGLTASLNALFEFNDWTIKSRISAIRTNHEVGSDTALSGRAELWRKISDQFDVGIFAETAEIVGSNPLNLDERTSTGILSNWHLIPGLTLTMGYDLLQSNNNWVGQYHGGLTAEF